MVKEKLLIITPSFAPNLGGIERHLDVTIPYFLNSFEVTVITIVRSKILAGVEKKGSLTIIRIFSPKIRFINLIYLPLSSIRWISCFRSANIIQVHDYLHFYYLVLVQYLFDWTMFRRTFLTFHGWEGVFPPKKSVVFFKRVVSNLVADYLLIGNYIAKWYKLKHTHHVSFGLAQESGSLKGLTQLRDLIIYSGRLEPDTGVFYLPEIFSQIQKFDKSKAHFVVLGEGSLKPWLKAALVKFGIEQVKFLGMVENVEPYLRRARIVVSSGYLGIIESLIHGCKVISVADHELKSDYLDGISSFTGRHHCILKADTEGVDIPKTFLTQLPMNLEEQSAFKERFSVENMIETYNKLWKK